MSVRYEKFLPKLMLGVMDCPEPVAIDALRSACIEFCEKSQWLRYEPEPMPLAIGVSTYPLDTPVGTMPAMVVDAWADGVRLTPQSEEQLTVFGTDWRDVTGPPRHFLQDVPDVITLYPQPDTRVEDGLKLRIAVRPSQDSQDVDDGIYEYWLEPIVAGALSRLYGQTGRPYSSPQQVLVQKAAFDYGVACAREQRQRSFTRGPLRVQMRRF